MPNTGDTIQAAVISNERETVILLPAGPIRSTVTGASGVEYTQTLHDDAQLGRPTHEIDANQVVYVYP